MKEKATLKYDEAIGGHKAVVAEHDKQAAIVKHSKQALHGINENYNEEGTDAENAEATKSFRDKAKSEDVVEYKKKLATKAASAGKSFDVTYVGNHIKEDIDPRAAKINKAAKERGEGVISSPGGGSLWTRVVSPSKVAAYRNYQKEGKKSKAEKAQDALNTILTEERKEKEKKGGTPPPPPPTVI